MTQNLNNIDGTLLSKLQKLASLAEGTSYDGERMRAEHLLNVQLAKYGLTLDDILNHKDKEEYTERGYAYKSEFEKKIIINSVAYIWGHTSDIFKNRFYRRRNSKMLLYLNATKSEHIIFEDFINFHLNNWRKQLETMQNSLFFGYLENQQLYTCDPEDNRSENKKGRFNKAIDMLAVAQFSKMNMGTYHKKVGKSALRLEEK